MDYSYELKELLRPLGVYAVDSGISGAELCAVGEALNGVWDALERAERESCPLTAEEEGLAAWEGLLPFVPLSRSTEGRRDAIAALLRIGPAAATEQALNDALAGCGIPAVVQESEDTPATLELRFPGTHGAPENYDALKRRIELLLPCHLDVEYVLNYLFWTELEALFMSWAVLNAALMPWDTLERQGGDEI